MTIIDASDPIEEARTFSKLSDRIYHFEHNGNRYTSFSDLVVPYSVGALLAIWAMTKSTIYHKLLDATLDVDAMRALNPDSAEMRAENIKIPMFMHNKMILVMKTWEPHQFEDVIPSFG
jgi:hypothetical protein